MFDIAELIECDITVVFDGGSDAPTITRVVLNVMAKRIGVAMI